MNFIKALVAWVSILFRELKTAFRLQQEAQAKQYAQQRLQQMLAVAYPHYIPFAGGVLRCFAALGKKFPEFIIPSRVEDVILPPLERVAPDGKGGVMFPRPVEAANAGGCSGGPCPVAAEAYPAGSGGEAGGVAHPGAPELPGALRLWGPLGACY